MKLSEITDEVIALANAIRDYWNAELPRRHPDYPLVHPGEAEGPPPGESKRLNDLLSGLPDDAVYQLVLLMLLGRGDFGPADLADHFDSLKERFGSRELAIAQLVGKVSLADYLADALAQLEKNGIDVNHLDVHSVHSAA